MGAGDDAAVDRVDFGHVGEFQQAVGGEPDEGFAVALPDKTAAGAFVLNFEVCLFATISANSPASTVKPVPGRSG